MIAPQSHSIRCAALICSILLKTLKCLNVAKLRETKQKFCLHTGNAHTHETKCSAVALIHHTQTHTYRRYSLLIWSLVGCFSFICRLFLFVINMTNIVSYYSVAWNRKQKFLFFSYYILFVLSDRLLRDGTNTIGHLVVRPFLYISLSIIRTNKKIARADVRLTGPAKTCSQLPNNWSGSGTAAISSDLFIYFYQCSIARSNFYLRKIFKSRLFLFFSFLSLSLFFFFWVTISFVADGGVFASS